MKMILSQCKSNETLSHNISVLNYWHDFFILDFIIGSKLIWGASLIDFYLNSFRIRKIICNHL